MDNATALRSLVCEQCNGPFTSKRRTTRFCSHYCRVKKWADTHRDKVRQIHRDWEKANPQKVSVHKKRMNALYADYKKKWANRNKDIVNTKTHRYRARKRGSLLHFSAREWVALKEKYKYTCLCCWIKEPEIRLEPDHVIPVSLCGSNEITNIQPLCRSCNASKGKKIIDYRKQFETVCAIRA